ncbi:cytoplasmic incompatibility factor CifB [Wolbachia endosymbiont of Cardiocondyla obscurior]|uniref:cytoplasmic incompatibility factor CifB n=1 Tax=Wolbachia endosymbiont of Cardiocondyla obscurior TaxID=2687307 RepID=UPI00157A9351|nr:cytoplasmic incompatibility factor CifB [Wolbachia endosymbiont of Cardiocondyla obscurior]
MSLVRSLVDGDLEGFRREFESFLDRCPSFVGYVGIGRFLSVFFFSMFATAHDAEISDADEEVYFRFDNHGIDTSGNNRNTGNLKVAVLTRNRDGKLVVKCYSISDRPNSDGLRFSEKEKSALVREIRRQNPELGEEELIFEQYKVCLHGKGKSQGEKGAVVVEAIREEDSEGRVRFAKYSASEVSLLRHIELDRFMEIDELPPRGVSTIKEIERMQLDQDQFKQLDELVDFAQIAPGQQRIDNFAEMLRSGIVRTLRGNSTVIFRYITRIYNNYRQVLEDNIEDRNQKFESHGFLLGFLANFSHLCTIDIDLELSPGNSYVAFLVRHRAERENVPIVVNLATRASSNIALNRARSHAERLHVFSFIPIHTESRNTVCVGLNFNLNRIPFRVDTVELQQDRFSLVRRLFECVENEEIIENIKDFLLQHIPTEIPINEENRDRILDCITGFAFGNSAFDNGYVPVQRNRKRSRLQATKHIFRYDDPDLRRCLTMVFHVQGLPIVILGVRAHDVQQQEAINLQDLNINRNNIHVWEVSCTLNDQFELDIDQPNDLGLYHDYQNNNANNFLDGDLIQVPNVENVHGISGRVMNAGWQNVGQHGELFQEISGILMPLMDAININSEDKLRSILHGTFYASDNPYKVLAMYKVGQKYSLKRGREEEGERVILTRITEQRLDLLLLRQSTKNAPDTHPIVYVLGFANNAEEVGQRLNEIRRQIEQFMKRERGYLPIIPEDEIVFCPVVLNVAAQRAEELITIPENLYIHKINRHYEPRGGGTPTAQGILERINNVLRDHDRGTIQDVNDLITLDFATDNGYYCYWFQQHDISYAARARRHNFPVGDEMQFHIMGIENDQVDVLETHIRRFKRERDVGSRRSTLIVNLGGNHWVTLVIDYRNRDYIGYYADSFGHNVPDSVRQVLEDNNVTLHDILIDQRGNPLVQQRDGCNCGFWALENARDINEVLQQNNNLGNQGRGVLDEMRNSLTLNVLGLNNIVDENNLRNEEYFKDLRRDISRELQDVNTDAGRARYITTDANGHANLNEIMAFIINNQNQTVIRNLLLEYLKLTLSHVQSLHFDKEQQAALLQFVSSSFPNASIELVKQGLYLPSFEKRGVNVNGKCVAITRSLSQALSLHKEKSFLNTLKTSTEIYERIAQGKQISKREEKEAFTFSKLLSNFEEQADCVTSTLPSSLTHSRSCKMLSDLSNYIAKINGDFALHLVTSNHVVAIYRMSDNYAYFDSNAAFVSELKSVDQLIQVVEKGIGFASYEIGEKGFLIEHFDVNQANDLLDDEDKQTLTREIKTERELLAEQDKELGLIKIDGQEVSRVQLYDFGTKINVKGSVPLLINADMKLNSKKFLDYLDKKEVSITAREYLDNLQNSKNVKEVVQATKAIPFEGSNREVKEAEHQRSQELKFSMKQLIKYLLIKYLLTAVIRQKSQLSEDNSKADDNSNHYHYHYLSSVTISSKPKESQRY